VSSLVGSCTDARHPTLLGRVCVRWTDANGEHERWLPALHNLAIRERDRVLLLRPANADSPIVIGVVDGFAKRPDPTFEAKHTVTLKPDESIRVVSEDGTELVTVTPGEAGPEIRLLQRDADVRLPGKLRLQAKSVEIVAEEGGVDIEANHDVTVRGEIIHLN
jgi:virulence-associated protein VagC